MDFDIKKEVKDFYGNIAKNVEVEEQSTCSCCKKPSRAERLYEGQNLEDIPLANETLDAIISNCVINLSSDKQKVYNEAYRVLKHGGRVAIADVVSLKPVSEHIKKQAQLWASCISGAMPIEDYIKILEKSGFKNISIEPNHVYTRDIIDGLSFDKSLISEEELNEMNGAFAGAHIKAWK